MGNFVRRVSFMVCVMILVATVGCASLGGETTVRNPERTGLGETSGPSMSQETICWPFYQAFAVSQPPLRFEQNAFLEIPWFAHNSLATPMAAKDLGTTVTSPFSLPHYFDNPLFAVYKSAKLSCSESAGGHANAPRYASITRWLSGLGGIFGMCVWRNDRWPRGSSQEFMQFFPASRLYYNKQTTAESQCEVVFLAKLFSIYRSQKTTRGEIQVWGAMPCFALFTEKSGDTGSVTTILDSEYLCWEYLDLDTSPFVSLYRREIRQDGEQLTQFLRLPIVGPIFVTLNKNHEQHRFIPFPDVFTRKKFGQPFVRLGK